MMTLQRSRQWQTGLALALLGAFYLLLRLPRLRAMPVFTDEATYLRWAQLIAEDPRRYLFVSMEDAKLPLHYWLLALVTPWARDPVLAGRLLSVGLGLLTIPALCALCRELARLRAGHAMNPLWLGIVGSLVCICCPFVALYQRLALAEALLLLEAVLLAWLSLRLARQAATGAAAAQRLQTAVLLGLTWAATLLTKQVFSYLCWMLPLAALAAWWGGRQAGTWRRFVPGATLATGMGLAAFVPVLFTDQRHDWFTKLFYKPVFRQTGTFSHWIIAWENIVKLLSPRYDRQAQWWPHDPLRPLQEGWLYVLLTPPVFLAVLAGLVWLMKRREWRVLAFLGTWGAVSLGAVIGGAGVLLSRYVLTGTLPLLLLAAWVVAEGTWRLRALGRPGALLTAGLLALLLLWPAWAVARSAADWRATVMPERDMQQYVWDGSSGTASEAAAAWLAAQASRRPVTLITGNWIGLPNDLLWLKAENDPRIALYWYDNKTSPRLQLAPGLPGCAMLGEQLWGDWHTHPVQLPPDRPIYLMIQGNRDKETREIQTYIPLAELPLGSRVVQVFTNPAAPSERVHRAEIIVVQIPPLGGPPLAMP